MGVSANNAGESRRDGRPRRRRTAKRGRLTPLIVIASIAAGLSVVGTTGTYALLSASASTSSTVISSGTAELTVSSLTLATESLYPGRTLHGVTTVTNTGDIPLVLQVSGLTAPQGASPNALAQALIIGVGSSSSAEACASGSVTPTWSGTFAAATAGPIGTTVPVGASQVLCISVALPLSAPAASQGKSADGFAVRIVGTQS